MELGRHHWSSPGSAGAPGHTRIVSRWLLRISREGDSTTALGSLCQHSVTCRAKFFPCSGGISCVPVSSHYLWSCCFAPASDTSRHFIKYISIYMYIVYIYSHLCSSTLPPAPAAFSDRRFSVPSSSSQPPCQELQLCSRGALNWPQHSRAEETAGSAPGPPSSAPVAS